MDAKERFKKWLKRFISSDHQLLEDEIVIKIPVSKQEIADLLSIRRETFSRMLAELKEEGVCEVKGKIFKISRIWMIEEK